MCFQLGAGFMPGGGQKHKYRYQHATDLGLIRLLGATAVSVNGKPYKINIGNGKPRA